jgi:hypothetical protein
MTPFACGRGYSLDYKGGSSRDLPDDASKPDELNALYTHFDNNNIVPGVKAVTDP